MCIQRFKDIVRKSIFSGTSLNFDDQALLATVEEDESLTTRMLAEDFNMDHSTMVRCFKKLGKV